MSERWAFRALVQPRSTQQYQPLQVKKDKALVERLHDLAQQHSHYGYRRITAKLKEEHRGVNRKRVQRLRRAVGLKVPTETHKRNLLGEGKNACHFRWPEHARHIWAIDLLMDSTLSRRRLKYLTVIDEFSGSCLSIKVERQITSHVVVAELERLTTLHGAPNFIRCDNGPEFIAKATWRFLTEAETQTLFVDLGSP